MEKAKVEYDKIKSTVDNLKEKIAEITEGEPREAKRLLDEAVSKLENTRSSINQVNVDIRAAERYFFIYYTYNLLKIENVE